MMLSPVRTHQRHLQRFKLRRGKERGENDRCQWTEKWDERYHAARGCQVKPDQNSEAQGYEAGEDARDASDQNIFPELSGDRLRQSQIRMLIFKFPDSQTNLAHFQQSKHRERENENGEADHGIEPGCDLLGYSNQPGRVESFGE
jgi:hypothetical protein